MPGSGKREKWLARRSLRSAELAGISRRRISKLRRRENTRLASASAVASACNRIPKDFDITISAIDHGEVASGPRRLSFQQVGKIALRLAGDVSEIMPLGEILDRTGITTQTTQSLLIIPSAQNPIWIERLTNAGAKRIPNVALTTLHVGR